MSKNLLIVTGLWIAAAFGYIIRGTSGHDLVYDYEDCNRPCEQNHDTSIVVISINYDRCKVAAREILSNDLQSCDHFNHNKPPFMVCFNNTLTKFDEALKKCSHIRDSLISVEMETYKSCKTDCHKAFEISVSNFF